MEFKGFYVLPAPPGVVWVALHDPGTLAASIPGCETVTKVSEYEYLAKAVIKAGPLKARFEGKVILAHQPAPPGYAYAIRLRGEGQGGAAGFARGESEVLLMAKDGGTGLSYGVNAIVGGRLAALGQRLLDTAAKALADEFFAKFAAQMAAPARVTEDYASSVPAAHTEHEQKKDEAALGPQIWIAGLIGIVILLLILFSIAL